MTEHESNRNTVMERENEPEDNCDSYLHAGSNITENHNYHDMKKSTKLKQRLDSSKLSGTGDKRTYLKKLNEDEKMRCIHNSREMKATTKTEEKHKLVDCTSTEKIVNGIDSCSGVSFEEALLLCGTVVSSKKSKRKKIEITNVEQDVKEVITPTLLKQRNLEPINMNRSSLLPKMTPTSRSLLKNSQTRTIVSKLMMCRNQSAKVYSGNKTCRKVETLFDTCLQVLQDNIDGLEYTGGVPYIILKPVLEQATANQLFKIEHYNPYLIENTDHMWKRHCEEEFRKKSRGELESWRDMYIRCLDEREKKLNMITANGGRDKLFGVRLAYVDSVVKRSQNARKRRRKKKRKLGTYKISNVSNHRYPEGMML